MDLNTGQDMDIDVFDAGVGELQHIRATDVSTHLKTVVTLIGNTRLGTHQEWEHT